MARFPGGQGRSSAMVSDDALQTPAATITLPAAPAISLVGPAPQSHKPVHRPPTTNRLEASAVRAGPQTCRRSARDLRWPPITTGVGTLCSEATSHRPVLPRWRIGGTGA